MLGSYGFREMDTGDYTYVRTRMYVCMYSMHACMHAPILRSMVAFWAANLHTYLSDGGGYLIYFVKIHGC